MLLTYQLDLEKLNTEFEQQKPQEIIAWAVETFGGKFSMTSSFGPESGALLHMASLIKKDIPVLFLETGFHFKETLEYKEKLTSLFGLTNVQDLRAEEEKRSTLLKQTENLPYEQDPDRCCQVNKVEPLDEQLKNYDAWMSGIRRHQTDTRKSVRILEEYTGEHFKVSPLANFTSRDAWWYLKEHNIPQHPLYEKGYMSIGCWPCTRPVQEGDDERTGRWAGKTKTECGIHTFKEIKPEDADQEKEPPADIGGSI